MNSGTCAGEEREGRLATVSGALLLGGRSRRMGRDKAALPLDGVPLATRTARILSELFEEVLLVGGTPPAGTPGRPVPDPPGPVCALRGLVTALEAAQADRLLVVATDLPLLSPDLLLALVVWPSADVVLPRTADGVQPLCAIYRRDTVLPVAKRRLQSGTLRMWGLLEEFVPSFLEGPDLAAVDPEGMALTNVNEPVDLSRAEAIAGAYDAQKS